MKTIKQILNLEEKLTNWIKKGDYDGFINMDVCCGCTFEGNEKNNGEIMTFKDIDEHCEYGNFTECMPGYISECKKPNKYCVDELQGNPCKSRLYPEK
jgi:hypothetical protein